MQAAAATQTLLRFQAHTMQAMYRGIAAALRETSDPSLPDTRRPQDYLLVLALGSREPEDGDSSGGGGSSGASSSDSRDFDIGAAFDGTAAAKAAPEAPAPAAAKPDEDSYAEKACRWPLCAAHALC